jgi:hypothetical protein
MKNYLISCLIGSIIGGFIVGFINYKNQPEEKIKIVKETETITDFIKIPGSPEEYVQAFNSKFKITGKIRQDWIDIDVSDGYKHGSKSFQLQSHDIRKNIIQSGYSFFVAGSQFYTAFDITYLRAWNNFAFGAGLMLNAWNQNKVYGIRVEGQFRW